eukprot:Skav222210  [mRNA]  locus=scaffold552:50971:53241:+ [translate_table: standard]
MRSSSPLRRTFSIFGYGRIDCQQKGPSIVALAKQCKDPSTRIVQKTKTEETAIKAVLSGARTQRCQQICDERSRATEVALKSEAPKYSCEGCSA